jgi:putative membrane protein
MFKVLVSGFLIGVANIIPGISGATIAVMTRQYTPIMTQLSYIITGQFRRIRWLYMVGIALAAITGIVALSWPLDYALTHYADNTFLGLIGLMVGSLGGIRMVTPPRSWRQQWVSPYTALGCGLVMTMVFVPITMADTEALSGSRVMVSGALAMAAMLIPGISGSSLLMILGTYGPIVQWIKHQAIGPLLPFIAGMGVGGVASVWGIRWVLNRWPRQAESLILGAILGSIGVIMRGVSFQSVNGYYAVAIFLMGCGAGYGMRSRG